MSVNAKDTLNLNGFQCKIQLIVLTNLKDRGY
jgi:hypothetical protein